MRRLRSLSEAECYTRLYGRDGDPAVTLLDRAAPRLRRAGISGEELRRLFEERIDSRPPGAVVEDEAA